MLSVFLYRVLKVILATKDKRERKEIQVLLALQDHREEQDLWWVYRDQD